MNVAARMDLSASPYETWTHQTSSTLPSSPLIFALDFTHCFLGARALFTTPGKFLCRLDMWWMLFPRWIWFLFGQLCVLRLDLRARALPMPMSMSKVVYTHAGMCPNEMNPNLWVDAMSTCMRECESDQVRSASSILHVRTCVSRIALSLHMTKHEPCLSCIATTTTCTRKTMSNWLASLQLWISC